MRLEPHHSISIERRHLSEWFMIMFRVYWELQAGRPVPADQIEQFLTATNEVGAASNALPQTSEGAA